MSIDPARGPAYAELGDAWVRHQLARLRQRHLQFGRRGPLDVDALLHRAAGTARAARAQVPRDDRLWRTMLEAMAVVR